MPEWMRIVPTVKEMALRLWVCSTIPALDSTRIFISRPPELDFIHLCCIGHHVHKAFKQGPRDFNHVGLLLGDGKMDVIPQMSPYQSNRIGKRRIGFAIPGRAAYLARALFDQQMRGQGDDRIQTQQGRRSAGDGAIIPLTLRFHPQVSSGFFKRHFHRPTTYKPRHDRS